MSSICLQICNKGKNQYAYLIETFFNPATQKNNSRTLKAYGSLSKLAKVHEDVHQYLDAELARVRKDRAEARILQDNVSNRFLPAVSDEDRENTYKAAPRFIYGDAVIRRLWEKLSLPAWFNKIKYNNRLGYNLDLAIFYMVVCRILMPCSRRHMKMLAPQFLFDYASHVTLDNLYDALDQLGKRKNKLMEVLKKQTGQFAARDTSLVFYDVTTFYFESFDPDTICARGMSKEHRTNETQVVLGLLIDCSGVPLSYELYRGNTPETRTLMPIISAYRKVHPDGRVIVVADRGLNSRSSLAELRANGCGYIVAHSLHKLKRKDQDEVFASDGWTLFTDPKTGEVLSRFKKLSFAGDDFEEKAKAGEDNGASEKVSLIVSWSAKREYNDLKQLEAQFEQARKLKESGTGAINAAFRRGSRQFLKGGRNNGYELNTALYEKKRKFAGYYGMVTSCTDLSSREIYGYLRKLWQIEENFRVMKTVLQSGPVYVRTEGHIRGHFAVCILALTLEWVMHKMLKDAGKDFSFEYLRDLLMAPTLSPLLTARSKEQIYLKTGLCLSSSSEKNAGELRDMVEEAEEVMKVFGIEKIRGLDSAPNIRRALAVNLPWTGNFSKRF